MSLEELLTHTVVLVSQEIVFWILAIIFHNYKFINFRNYFSQYNAQIQDLQLFYLFIFAFENCELGKESKDRSC